MKKLLLAFMAALLMQATTAFAIDEGFEYKLVKPAMGTTDKTKIEVVEFFWYGCPHCYSFEPGLNKWLKTKPANVNFVRIPAIFRETWAIHARAYYTAEALGILDKTHNLFFKALHKDRIRLATEKDIAAFFVSNGVTQEAFTQAWNSFVVQSRVKRAITLTRRSGITAVPSMIVNGKYRTSSKEASINNPGGAGHENVLRVVDALIKKESSPAKATAKK